MSVKETPLIDRVDVQAWGNPKVDRPGAAIFSESFTGGIGAWTATSGSTLSLNNTQQRSAPNCARVGASAAQWGEIKYTATGLAVGAPHTLRAWVKPESTSLTSRIYVTGSASAPVTVTGKNTYTELVYTFTATATTAEIVLGTQVVGAGIYAHWDDVSLVQEPWTETLPEQWMTYIPNATGLTIRRGGARDGLGVKTDVGLCTFTLKNDQDPMAGGTFKPGQRVRVVTGEQRDAILTPVYSFGFEVAGYDGWTVYGGTQSWGSTPHSGTRSMTIARTTTSGDIGASRSFSGLKIGQRYQFSVWVRANLSIASDVRLRSDPSGDASTATALSLNYIKHTLNFTATATTHTLWIDGLRAAATTWSMYLDDFELSEYYPPKVRTEIFTGQIADISSTYPLNKQTGESRAMVTVTVADAVGVHTRTPRYGVQIASGFETFEARINRLAASASSDAPVETLTEGAPREVYSF